MSIQKLWEFPVPSNCIANGVVLIYAGGDAIIKFDYFDENENGVIYNGSIRFKSVMAHRHSTEKFTNFIQGAYDTVIEIQNSKWAKELYKLNPEDSKYWDIKHYAIYLDSFGLYEFIAQKFIQQNTTKGEIPEKEYCKVILDS